MFFREAVAPEGVSPAARDALVPAEIAAYIKRGVAGDCIAADALADHYLNVALNYESGLMWSRVATACPNIRPKVRLIYLLAQLPESIENTREIDVLLNEVHKN